MNEKVIKALNLLVGEHYVVRKSDVVSTIAESLGVPVYRVRDAIKEEAGNDWSEIVYKIIGDK